MTQIRSKLGLHSLTQFYKLQLMDDDSENESVQVNHRPNRVTVEMDDESIIASLRGRCSDWQRGLKCSEFHH